MTRQNELTNGWRVGAARLNRAAPILFREGWMELHKAEKDGLKLCAKFEGTGAETQMMAGLEPTIWIRGRKGKTEYVLLGTIEEATEMILRLITGIAQAADQATRTHVAGRPVKNWSARARDRERVAHQIVERVKRMNAEIEARILAHQQPG